MCVTEFIAKKRSCLYVSEEEDDEGEGDGEGEEDEDDA
jgi:hypothetical protein